MNTVVQERASQRNGLFGFLEVVFALVLVRGVPGASTTAGQIAVIVFGGGLFVGVGLLWIHTARVGGWIEVSEDAIVQHTKRGVRATLARRDGDALQFVMRRVTYRYRELALVQTASNSAMGLQFYRRQDIAQAVRQHGWELD